MGSQSDSIGGGKRVDEEEVKYTQGYPNNFPRYSKLFNVIGTGMRFWWKMKGRENGLDKQVTPSKALRDSSQYRTYERHSTGKCRDTHRHR